MSRTTPIADGIREFAARDFRAAAESFTLAVERAPGEPRVRKALAWALYHVGHPELATEVLDDVAAEESQDATTTAMRVLAHVRRGDRPRALQLVGERLRDAPMDVALAGVLAEILSRPSVLFELIGLAQVADAEHAASVTESAPAVAAPVSPRRVELSAGGLPAERRADECNSSLTGASSPKEVSLQGMILEPEIPPPQLNFNQNFGGSLPEYVREFKASACLKEFPFLVRRARLSPGSAILDYGCGLGRLAYPASKYLSSDGAYFGYEPNQEALRFLRGAYAGRENMRFDGIELSKVHDYVAVERHRANPSGVEPTTLDLTQLCVRPADCQYSSSVFTHMWSDGIIKVLEEFTKVMAPGGICINTWLIIDEHAHYTLRCGVADRALPHKVNGAWTYSTGNPLVCTAYELEDVRGMYEAAGHEVIEVLHGSWSGGRDNGVHYQDIVVSRAK